MADNYTHLSDISVRGSVQSSIQGIMIGSMDVLPPASEQNAGAVVLYTGETDSSYVHGYFYISDGSAWSEFSVGSSITIDTEPSTTSQNPLTNAATTLGLNSKVDAVEGKGLSANDYTDEEKAKLAGIEDSAQVNVIEVAKLNGEAIVIAGKTINIDLGEYETIADADARFALKSEIVGLYRLKGSITYAEMIALKTAEVGDVYDVTDKGGMNYVCVVGKTPGASSWDELGSITDTSDLQKKAVIAVNVAPVWSADTTYAGYAYKGTLSIEGMTANHVPTICFTCTDSASGNYAPIAESDAGKVYIWSKTNEPTTIATVVGIEKQ